MATDSPDWQEVVTLTSGGAVPDAPDWQRTVTGPGAASISSAFPPHVVNNYAYTPVGLNVDWTNIIAVNGTAAVDQWCNVSFGCQVTYATTAAATDGFEVFIDLNYVPYGNNDYYCIPGFVAPAITQPVLLSFWTFQPAGSFMFMVVARTLGTATASIRGVSGGASNFGILATYT